MTASFFDIPVTDLSVYFDTREAPRCLHECELIGLIGLHLYMT